MINIQFYSAPINCSWIYFDLCACLSLTLAQPPVMIPEIYFETLEEGEILKTETLSSLLSIRIDKYIIV